MNTQETKRRSVTVGLPVFRLVGPNGEYGGLFHSLPDADAAAKRAWPNHHQDNSGDYEEPNGWDIAVVGAE